MNKKFLILLVVLMVSLVFVACTGTGNKTPSPGGEEDMTNSGKEMEDGIYTAESTHEQNGWYTVEAEIADGKFTDIQFTKFNEDGEEVDLDEYPHPPAAEAVKEYPKQFLQEQDLSKVDVISGATGTYESFKEVVGKVIKEAER